MAKLKQTTAWLQNLETGEVFKVNDTRPTPAIDNTDVWMQLMQEFSNQLQSPGIPVGDFIEKMKEKFILSHKS